jgi:biopolymer transport protein ExbD
MALQVGAPRPADEFELGGKRKSDDEVDITPMIDIVFLLLIFFVVCSKMDPSKTGAVPAADRGVAISANDSAVIIMERGAEDRAVVKRYDGSKFLDDDEQQRNDIVEYVSEQLEGGKNEVMIVGHHDVPVGEVGRVQRIIADGFDGLKTTYIAVKEE